MIRLGGRIERSEVASLATHASGTVVACGPGVVNCDVGAVAGASLPTIAVLARLALVARQTRRELRLEHASPDLLELVELCGLHEVLPCAELPGPGRSTQASNASGSKVIR